MVDNKELKSEALAHEMDWDTKIKEADEFILESSAAIVVNDETGEIIRVTKEAEEGLGYLANELIGEKLERLVPSAVRGQHAEYRKGQTGMPITRQMAYGREVKAVMKDGRERKATISLKSKYIINKRDGSKQRWTRAKIIFSPLEEK